MNRLFTPEDVAAAIEAALPCPKDIFEEGRYLLLLEEMLKDLSVTIRARFNEILPELRNTESETYEVRQIIKTASVVDVERLRKMRPDILSRIVYVYAFDAVKLIGRTRLYELCAALPEFDCGMYDRANLGDLQRVLPKEECTQFIKTEERPAGWEIVLRELREDAV
ncbi:MAG TPA: hypothetical protein O0X39_07055 [Methanocorpusculum sp.]|nr:hypothetical protein [Methanocorpusculum sp.]